MTMSSVVRGFDDYANNEEERNWFTPKFQLSVKNNPLVGIRFMPWISLLQSRWHQIEFSSYWPRILVITCLSVLNSLLAIPERLWYGRRIDETVVPPAPIFVLGHPRTGTTLLHSLLALDQDHVICSTFCAGFPSCFLWFESIGKRLFAGAIDDKRPMDNVPLDFDLPQEDELATNLLCGGVSPYMPLYFMKQESEFRPYYAFDDNASAGDDEHLPAPEMAQARTAWTDAFLHLLRKLTLRAQLRTPSHRPRQRCLLLKSPVHTARIPLLLRLFPDSQFLYIHRHPYDVFRSAVHMADTTYWYTYLNTPTEENIIEFILRQYEILWDRYEQGRQLLDKKQYMEISFEELSERPQETIHRIYDTMGWTMSKDMRERLAQELESVQSYQRNRHRELPPHWKKVVHERWRDSFQRLGYKAS